MNLALLWAMELAGSVRRKNLTDICFTKQWKLLALALPLSDTGRSLLSKVLATLSSCHMYFLFLFLPPSFLPSPFSALTKDFLDDAIFPGVRDRKGRSKAFERRRHPSKFQQEWSRARGPQVCRPQGQSPWSHADELWSLATAREPAISPKQRFMRTEMCLLRKHRIIDFPQRFQCTAT